MSSIPFALSPDPHLAPKSTREHSKRSAPVQASAILHVNQQTSTAFSGYYANGQPTTINGQNS
ncbi:hypothetical protein [Ktedonobacter robiniae]|uniref:hypothetical protein n=1 Tax=Ktedonobacter robiniae TaxID=2778365 RepID=UPI001915F93A|nr:hypothetical protein [Ktedonobacter robiniae]